MGRGIPEVWAVLEGIRKSYETCNDANTSASLSTDDACVRDSLLRYLKERYTMNHEMKVTHIGYRHCKQTRSQDAFLTNRIAG